jgi:hypothetical protein
MKTILSTLAFVALIASPALAQYAGQRSQAQRAPSQEDRAATGHERTCGFTVYQYDSEGTPTGPYCH